MDSELRTPLTDQDLREIEARLAPLIEREQRARELAETVPRARVFVGVCGLSFAFQEYELRRGFATIRAVTNPPGVVHVMAAASLSERDYLAVSRYSHAISGEIAFGSLDLPEERQVERLLVNLAWHTAALIKLRTKSSLLCPAWASASWDVIASINDNSLGFRVLDDIPRQIITSRREAQLTADDMDWVRSNWDAALDLRNAQTSGRFGLAFSIAYVWNHTSDPRIALANLWCGLEALFGVQTDQRVTASLVRRISDWLPGTSESEIRDLYASRSAAVHGRRLDDTEIGSTIARSEHLLQQSLIKSIETRTATLPDWQ